MMRGQYQISVAEMGFMGYLTGKNVQGATSAQDGS